MKILTVCHQMNAETGGGNAERVLQLSKAFLMAGATATVLTQDSGLTPARYNAFGAVKIVALPCLQGHFPVPVFSGPAIENAIAEAEVIHLTNHWTVLNAMAANIATKMHKPYVVCPAGALPVFGRSRLLKTVYNAVVGKRVIHDARGWVAITNAERSQFLPYAVDPSSVTVIPNGTWIEEFSENNHEINYRAHLCINDAPVVLFVGRLSSIKGPDILLEAFEEVRRTGIDAHLIFAGPDVGMQQDLARRVKECGLSTRVHFLGYLAHPEKLAAYGAADIVVVPSRSEAMSLVALEAGACGKPVILTDRCGFDEVAAAGGGMVVPADAHSICEALLKLLKDAALRKQMGENLKQLVESRYTWPKSARQYLDLFTSVKSGRR